MTTVDRGAPSLTLRQRGKLRDRLVTDRLETQAMVDTLMEELESFQASRQSTTTDDGQDPEGPAIDFERSQSTMVLTQSRNHLDQIDRAMARLEGDSFGSCARCGSRIPFARLEARPYTAHCVSCAERLGH
jgi:RNA polymerase-binding transcription factor DksA